MQQALLVSLAKLRVPPGCYGISNWGIDFLWVLWRHVKAIQGDLFVSAGRFFGLCI
ncbi:protein of unknown function [Burkholderia multivorans]